MSLVIVALGRFSSDATGQVTLEELPVAPAARRSVADYLITPQSFSAGVYRSKDGRDVVLDNGLIRRTFRVTPNGACVGFTNLMTGQQMLRSVRSEAVVTIDGRSWPVGGLVGQPSHAYLTDSWLDQMTADPKAMRLTGVHVGQPTERFAWARPRHAAPDVVWPPRGVSLRMDYVLPPDAERGLPSELARVPQWSDNFSDLTGWKTNASSVHPRVSFENEGKPGEIYAPPGAFCFAQRPLAADTSLVEVLLRPGTDTATSWGPGLAWVFEGGTVKLNLRPGDRGEHGLFELRVNGREQLASPAGFAVADGGLDLSCHYRLRLRIDADHVVAEAAAVRDATTLRWTTLFRISRSSGWGRSVALRVGKMDRQAGATDDPHGLEGLARMRIESAAAWGPLDMAAVQAHRRSRTLPADSPLVSVHYELYDGVPVISKWITIRNNGEKEILLDRFTGEQLAVVEQDSWVETRDGVPLPEPRYLHAETDYCFGGMNAENANRHGVHWREDPLYSSQVNWARKTPCLLVCEPTYGPAQRIAPGETFAGFRVFELVFASEEREHQGLARRKMYRTIAPWVTENPITHHLLSKDPQKVREAIDKAADVGFEAIILSFGSGFNMENTDPEFLKQWKSVADYAQQRGVELGCYSLLSSRGVAAEHMSVLPDGQKATHGRIPSLASQWGQNWIRTVREFYRTTGFAQFENDGPWPGDIDITPRPPIQRGIDDSRWALWQQNNRLYRGLRHDGVYINQPDFHFLNGGNKGTMGYREVNWSLPRAQQVIHTRQNIYDGTWTRTPSMGWMHVPLTQYHGGGAAATIEPLHEHRDHYRRMLQSNLGMGVQAHYRGPRLYDTPETRQTVREVVDWFVQYRDILESDIVHGRRADGRAMDWVLHANSQLENCGMLVVYNPLDEAMTRTLRVNLYYTGLTETAVVTDSQGGSTPHRLARDFTVDLPVSVPAGQMAWYRISRPQR
ncbi:MAG: hypothetical protein NXI04_16135 [Planctomycetaceae bacterium]|nr:hypothetical protein [Planctomycetaceae bacterium]